ncbi:ABC transporter substrate-binding protein [Ramlibacter pallidus]|uniref:ABC transporter substrate-binding protein n=1 Tax=Ramlibacter pallidus TaxID=2780087 RepID=A0ABR9S0I6_9BURK|nr:ABC transporter substrate-binding protein [Ramlibacter pallidus]MBE7367029.1 ABC transporter substrate-binding protein [Ramlibacter pallidus]
MTRGFPLRRRTALSSLVVLGSAAAGLGPALAQPARSALNLAMVAEPPTLDIQSTPADLVCIIMQHVYEPLYTFDAKAALVPMLAESMPKISPDGKLYTIPLRKGVKLHNGRDLHAEDVAASLKRWMEVSPRGKSIAVQVVDVLVKGPLTVDIVMRNAYAPLLSQLAMASGMAAIMAKESLAQPLREYVGTGPYRFKERRPDQYVRLTRFDGYSARTEAPSGYGGKRQALVEELRFVPVPNANTRVEGALAGQFHYADLLPIEALSRLEKAKDKVVPMMTPSFGFPYLVFNTREGSMAQKSVRKAVQTALGHGEMLAAGFGDTRFFIAEGNHFPKGTPFYSTAGTENYNERDAKKAKAQAEQAGYKGETVRILTSRQYDFHYNMALIMAEQLKRAGFKAELNVVEWATLLQRRADPKLWDIYITHSGQFPEPMLSPPQLGDGAPGWWSSPAKQEALAALNQEPNPAKRGPLWGKVQQVVYDEVPYVNVGKFASLSARAPALQNYTPHTYPFFWNTSLKG